MLSFVYRQREIPDEYIPKCWLKMAQFKFNIFFIKHC